VLDMSNESSPPAETAANLPGPVVDDASETAATGDRPRTVDWAWYAIIARCVLVIAFALSLFSARTDLVASIRTSAQAKGWTDEHINSAFDSSVRTNLLIAIVGSVLIMLVAKYIRDGRNWARWLFTILVVLPFSPLSDVARIIGFTASVPILVRVLSVLTGVAALAAVVLLFVGPSKAYFRKPATADGGATPASPFGGLFKPRPVAAPASNSPAKPGKPAVRGKARSSVADGPSPAKPTGPAAAAKRPAPRAKSRKAPTE
jgi:hypothetical protein